MMMMMAEIYCGVDLDTRNNIMAYGQSAYFVALVSSTEEEEEKAPNQNT